MTFMDIFGTANYSASLALFDTAAIAEVEAKLTVKNNKPHFRCPVRDKDIQAKPEEIIRQLWIHRLLNEYRYPLSRLSVEFPITFGRDSSKRADIVVFDVDRPTLVGLVTIL
jgi:type I restriction enzyme M protein